MAMSRLIVAALLMALTLPSAAHAQNSSPSVGSRIAWTAAGAGAGFGVGLFAGLAAFDDALYSDRKVWTSVIAGSAAGGITGYLLGRARDRRSSSPSRTTGSRPSPVTLDPAAVDALARQIRLRTGR